MYRLLIVDDDIHAVNGIKSGVEWSRYEILEVYTAYNGRHAREVFAEHPVDLMICDIEMPQESGLELLAWVRENHAATKCIFLTCHADFTYAKEAIRLGGFGYLLKPVIFSELQDVIAKAVCMLGKEREASETHEKSSHYYNLWLMHQPLLVERFWMDLLDGRIPAEPEAIRQYLAQADIQYTGGMRYMPILIKVQRWHSKVLLREERLKEHELRNRALQILIGKDNLSQVLQLRRGLFLALHVTDGGGSPDKARLKAQYQAYLDACTEEFGCDISCYAGAAVAMERVPEAYEALLEFDRNFVISNRMAFIDEHFAAQKPVNPIIMDGWHELFLQGKREKWRGEAGRAFASLSGLERFDAKLLHGFFHDFMQLVYSVLKRKDLPAHLIFSQGETLNEDELALGSLDALQEIIRRIGEKAFDAIEDAEKERSITDKIKLYISQNMGYDLSRESIAREFYLNPDYMTRIFKKETGQSISDYLIHERVSIAKDLLVNTDLSVKDIVSRVGYTNFSYFSKIFKDATGMNPLAYRKANAH